MISRSRAGRSPLVFFASVFGLSLPFWLIGALFPHPSVLPMGLPASSFQFVVPMVVAGILVYRHQGRRGLAALSRRTVSVGASARPAWWLLALTAVPAMMAATYGIMALTGNPPRGGHSSLIAIPSLLLLYLVAALGEEAGWMGYAAGPLIRRWGPVASGLTLGVAWALWHVVGYIQADRSALWIVGQCLSSVAIRVLMVWMYVRMSAAVLPAIVMHASINVTQSVFPGFTERPAPALIFGLVCAATATVGIAITARNPLAPIRLIRR
ncbi:CPBP family glutamic-type intramembrane protease [Mycobacterium sp. NPDC003449]